MGSKYQYLRLLFYVTRVINKIHLPFGSILYTLLHRGVEKRLKPIVEEVCADGSDLPIGKTSFPKTIWFYWDSGIENAPELVKLCLKQLQNGNPKYHVIVVDSLNLPEYLNIPEFVIQKRNSGTISKTHMSDIVRMGLLSQYGGLWVDATVLSTLDKRSVDPSAQQFFTVKLKDTNPFFVARGRWSGFLIGGNRFRPVAAWVYKVFLKYWESNSTLINYFLIDYVLDIAYQHNIADFKDLIDETPYTNDGMHELVKIASINDSNSTLNDLGEFDLKYENTNFFKLTYKRPISMSRLSEFLTLRRHRRDRQIGGDD